MGQTISSFIFDETSELTSELTTDLNIEDTKVNELEKGNYYEFLNMYHRKLHLLENHNKVSLFEPIKTLATNK